MTKKVILLILTMLNFNICFSQEGIKSPFKFDVKINNYSDSSKLVSLKVCNKSFKTIFVSDYPPSSSYLDESLCSFSLNYSTNYSDPMLMPNIELKMWKLSPFRCFNVDKIKKTNHINTIYVDFDFYFKSFIKKSSVNLTQAKDKKKVTLTMKEFFVELFFEVKQLSYLSEKIKIGH